MARRVHQRFPVDLPAQLLASADDLGGLDVRLKDISRGGAFVATRAERAAGSGLLLQVLDGELPTLLVGAQVVHRVSPQQAELWGSAAGLGLRFVDVDGEAERALQGWLDAVAARLDRVLDDAPCDVSLLRALEAAQRLGDLCAMLGVEPLAPSPRCADAVEQRSEALSAILQRDDLSSALRKRLIAGRLALQRAGDVLGDDAQRSAYLRRIGILGGSTPA